ncbi:MAG: bifunctional riboflavin kinase/FAD synthetase [Gammaproteobacteria bacterium]|jgi:riboflavin kinase/FMN adenylyltransferase|nr:bifunctional riboflavin kinase/FAD synthetase [Gammaproteobacteria bacterium]MDP6616013.1 bifunctional riboflavin kinase/FAD synthetase [Gammaproteobacteria bacterium]MDP6695149.1 bifunctional riboflavin kinase/FAD synthetase [Gammaproteobacteria bacterium]MDP7041214.1 bifunctional riboflavin kinase/FAD synthetase [Gammaproteobacteria bacterium]
MLLIRRPAAPVPGLADGCVATIGAFDGLHVGHQRILDRVLEVAHERKLPSLIFSFEPTPKEYFAPQSPPARLMRFRERYQALEEIGIDFFYCPHFEPALEALEPDIFVDSLLVGLLHVRHLVVGDDFVFARKRSGTIDDLSRKGAECGFGVEQVGSVIQQDERVSSSAVRRALYAGDLEKARRLLGRWYYMSGKVVLGQKLGRTLGMPTANVKLNRKLSPVHGIYAVRVRGLNDDRLDGVASVGTRPTIDGVEPLLEVHIFDFDRDIYGANIQVEFVAKLRDEVRFPDLETLREQMFKDAEQAREVLAAA